MNASTVLMNEQQKAMHRGKIQYASSSPMSKTLSGDTETFLQSRFAGITFAFCRIISMWFNLLKLWVQLIIIIKFVLSPQESQIW